jgi:hypothetical protein
LAVQEGDPLAGKIIAKYRLEKRLAHSSSVYRATDLETSRSLAIKILPENADPREVARFRRAADASSKLRHMNIVTVRDHGTAPSGLSYLVMEYLSGRSVASILEREKRFPTERAANIARQLAAALVEAHRMGAVHSGLGADKVMLIPEMEDGEHVVVLGFCADEDPPLGMLSDLSAFGVLLSEMVELDSELGRLAVRLIDRDPRLQSALQISAEISRIFDEAPRTELLGPIPAFTASIIPTDVTAPLVPLIPDSALGPTEPQPRSIIPEELEQGGWRPGQGTYFLVVGIGLLIGLFVVWFVLRG